MKIVTAAARLLRRQRPAAAHENPSGRNVLAISMPKCGTHLLTRLVAGLTQCTRSNVALRTSSVDEAQHVIEQHLAFAVGQQLFLRGHQIYTPEIEALLTNRGFRILMILRDPRDTVVSHAHWVTTEQHASAANRRFYQTLETMDERLLASICGRPVGWNEGAVSADESKLLNYHGVRDDIGQRLNRYLPWIESDAVCLIRFENLVGAEGGGCDSLQRDEIRRAATHLGIERSDFELQGVASALFDRSAKTFRSGMIGGWMASFNSLHKLAFKALAGDVLIKLGYEQDHNW